MGLCLSVILVNSEKRFQHVNLRSFYTLKPLKVTTYCGLLLCAPCVCLISFNSLSLACLWGLLGHRTLLVSLLILYPTNFQTAQYFSTSS